MRILIVLLAALIIPLEGTHAVSFAATDGLLIEYDSRSDGPAPYGRTPLLRVFGDGRLEVAIPYLYKRAGYYVGQLDDAELAELTGMLEDRGVLDLRVEDVEREFAAAKAGSGTDSVTSETVTTRFSFALEGARTMTSTEWRNLRFEHKVAGKRAPSIQALWAAKRRFDALTEHPSLKRIGTEAPGGLQR